MISDESETMQNVIPSLKKTVVILTLASVSLMVLPDWPSAFAQEMAAPVEKKPEEKPEFWESYTGGEVTSGKDVTSGVNVQDIISASHEYNYASFGKTNPFIPPLLSTHLAKLEIPIVSILQRHPIEQLSVVGIWTLENSARKSLIMTPENEGVITAVGDPIGNRGGKIISIEQDLVKVREFSLAPDGTRQFEDFDLWLGNEIPVEQEKIIIKSKKLNSAGSGLGGQDFLDSTEKEQNRMNRFMDTASDSMTIEAPANAPQMEAAPGAEAGIIAPPAPGKNAPAPPAAGNDMIR